MQVDHWNRAGLEWTDDGVPYSPLFGDRYFGDADGIAEASHVYLQGNGLPLGFRDDFHIAELGFGTGLNMCVALRAWRQHGMKGTLLYTGFEAYPLEAADLKKVAMSDPRVGQIRDEFLHHWSRGATSFALPGLRAEIVLGDARITVPAWKEVADAWFLDGFAPDRNPELWEPDLLRAVARKTVLGGTFATYSAAGDVRRVLALSGFAIERIKGYGRKRHMTRGVKVE